MRNVRAESSDTIKKRETGKESVSRFPVGVF